MSGTTVSGRGTTLRCALLLLALCGGLYPVLTTTVAGALFPYQATGSLIVYEGRVVGSALVGQGVVDPRYFHGRPSAAGYDPFSVSGSNAAPGNPDLRAAAGARSEAIVQSNGITVGEIPVDLIAASGSGIDPHISPDGARLQVRRVAAARGLDALDVERLVERHVEPPVLGILGQPRVNVLRLNLALDTL